MYFYQKAIDCLGGPKLEVSNSIRVERIKCLCDLLNMCFELSVFSIYNMYGFTKKIVSVV